MTFEPGTADILTTCALTTCAPPVPPETENAVLRAVFERAARDYRVVSTLDGGKWRMTIEDVEITADERETLTRIAWAAHR